MTPMTVSARLLAHGYKFPTSTFADQLDAGAYAVVGSRLYGLADKTSDTDYVCYYMPTFEELYKHEFFQDSFVTPDADFSIRPLTALPDTLCKLNPTGLDFLFSRERHAPAEFFDLYMLRENLIRSGRGAWYMACLGVIKSEVSRLKDFGGKDGERWRAIGYNAKCAMHAERLMHLIVSYHAFDGELDAYDRALRFDYLGNVSVRNDLLNLRSGKEYPADQIACHLDCMLQETIAQHEDFYLHDGKPIVEAEFYTLKHTVHEVVMRAVKDNISYTMDN